MTITPEEIEKLRGLLEKATPGPWLVRLSPQASDDFFVQAPRLRPTDPYDIEVLGQDRTLYDTARADAEFIAAARNTLPALLSAYETEKAVREQERNRFVSGASAERYWDARWRDEKAAREQAEQQSLESSVLAHAWMARHDRIAAGKEGGPFPAPADTPRLIARAEAAEARAEKAEADLADAEKALDWLNGGAELQLLMKYNNELMARADRLAKALEPFGSMTPHKKIPDDWSLEQYLHHEDLPKAMMPSVADIRRARAALAEEPKETGNG